MERLGNKSIEELKKIRNDYVEKYIGNLHKPTCYKLNLKMLDRTIRAKG